MRIGKIVYAIETGGALYQIRLSNAITPVNPSQRTFRAIALSLLASVGVTSSGL